MRSFSRRGDNISKTLIIGALSSSTFQKNLRLLDILVDKRAVIAPERMSEK
jgi:hypothetical protein